jgi:hypothetical protein
MRAESGSGHSKYLSAVRGFEPRQTTPFSSPHTLHNVGGMRLERAIPIDAETTTTTNPGLAFRTNPPNLGGLVF